MKKEIIEELDKILPVVEKVHGNNHPELHEVVKLYKDIKENNSEKSITELKKVTNNFTIPKDVCPTFEKTYKLLNNLIKK